LALHLTSKKQESPAVYNFLSNLLPDSDIIITRMQQRLRYLSIKSKNCYANCWGIHNVEQRLPPDFSSHISDAIFEGLEKQAGKILFWKHIDRYSKNCHFQAQIRSPNADPNKTLKYS
jgi:hypothetical protein